MKYHIALGTDSDSQRHTITIETRVKTRTSHPDRNPTPYRTTDHTLVATYLELGIQGEIYDPGCRQAHSCGHTLDDHRRATFVTSPMPSYARHALFDIWDKWHLNGLSAGCCHQPQTGTYDQNRHAPCPLGYVYGSAWLVRVIPPDVIATLHDLLAAYAVPMSEVAR